MADDSAVLGQLAEEFSTRVRLGQMPAIEEYAARHPALAERIRALFPTLMLLEGLAAGGATTGEKQADQTLQPGEQFGPYQIEKEIGRGGMGIVYEAVHLALERRVALKVLPLHGPGQATHLERFLREARTAAGLHHTNIVPVFDVGQVNGILYYAMQLIDGQGLDHCNRAAPPNGTVTVTLLPSEGMPSEANPVVVPVPARRQPAAETGPQRYNFVAEVGIQAAEALAYAHARGVIHRDIKPSNLLLDGQGVVWITDFGLARRLDDVALTHTGQLLGTPRYMSPEQALAAKEPVDHRTDIYSLGATLYELVTRQPAFDGRTPHDVVLQILQREPIPPRRLDPKVPRDLETIVMKAMAKRATERYQSAQELADDLRRFARNEPIRARRIGPAGRLWRWARRNPVVAGLLAAVAMSLLCGMVTSWTLAREAMHQAQAARWAKEDALGSAAENRRLAAEQMVRQGVRLQEEGDFAGALLLFAEALQRDENDPDRADLHRLRLQSLEPFCPRPEHIWGHAVPVSSPGFSTNGKRVVTECADGTVRVWDVESGKRTCPPLMPEKRSWAALSDDGRKVITVSLPGMGSEERLPQDVSVWDADTGRRLFRQSSSREGLFAGSLVIDRSFQPQLSPDGRRVLTLVDSRKVQVWSTETGKPIGPPLEHGQWLVRVAFLGEERILTLTMPTADKKALDQAASGLVGNVWDAPTGKSILKLEPRKGRHRDHFLSPDSRWLLAGDVHDGLIIENVGVCGWDLTTGRIAWSRPAPWCVHDFGFSADSQRVLLGHTPGHDILVCASDTGRELTVAPVEDRFPSWKRIEAAPDGRRLALSSGESQVWDQLPGRGGLPRVQWHVWDAVAGRPTGVVLQANRDVWGNIFQAAQFSPDGRCFAAPGAAGVDVWDALTGARLQVLPHEESVESVAFSPDSQRLLTISGPTARIWPIRQTPRRPGLLPGVRDTDPVGLCADGSRLWSLGGVGGKPVLTVWDTNTRQGRKLGLPADAPPDVFNVSLPELTVCRLSAEGRHLLAYQESALVDGSPTRGRVVWVWDTETGNRSQIDCPAGVVRASFSPDGRYLAIGHASGEVLLCSVEGTVLARLTHDKGSALDCRFSADGQQLVVFDRSDAPQLVVVDRSECEEAKPDQAPPRCSVWEVPGGRRLAGPFAVGTAKDVSIEGVIFSPDCHLLLVRYHDSARVWDATTGQPVTGVLSPFDSPGSPLVAAEFSPDGQHILLASFAFEATEPGRSAVFETTTGRLLWSRAHLARVRAAHFSPDDQRVLTSEDGTVRLWDTNTGDAVLGPLRGLGLARFSSDGKFLLTGSAENIPFTRGRSVQERRVWDARTGLPVTPPLPGLPGSDGERVSRDGRRIVLAWPGQGVEVFRLEADRRTAADWWAMARQLVGDKRTPGLFDEDW